MIYLDYAAATPVHPRVLEAMLPFFSEQFYNPSAPYLAAKKVKSSYEVAKSELARTIGAKAADLVITSGATESINLAFTALNHLASAGASTIPAALVLETEHASVLETAKLYPHQTIKVLRSGLIDLDDFKAKLTDQIVFISISLANNELGTIQPFSEIVEIIKKERQRRLLSGNKLPLILHSDASQALNLIDVSISRLGVDLLTINSAKIYGPKGIGALYIGHGIKLSPITYGGGQERGLRSGTENVPLLIGFATAAQIAKSHLSTSRKAYQNLKKILKNELSKSQVSPLFLGDDRHQLDNFLPVSFPGIDAERIIYKLETDDIYLSTGAACAASKGQKSHVLSSIKLSDAEITGSLRISLGSANTPEGMVTAGQAIVATVNAEALRTGLIMSSSKNQNHTELARGDSESQNNINRDQSIRSVHRKDPDV